MAAPTLKIDPFGSRDTFETGSGPAGIYRLSKLEEMGLTKVDALPFSIRVLLESLLRNCDGYVFSEDDVKNLANWTASRGVLAPGASGIEVPFQPARVVLQDFTGVPAIVDLGKSVKVTEGSRDIVRNSPKSESLKSKSSTRVSVRRSRGALYGT